MMSGTRGQHIGDTIPLEWRGLKFPAQNVDEQEVFVASGHSVPATIIYNHIRRLWTKGTTFFIYSDQFRGRLSHDQDDVEGFNCLMTKILLQPSRYRC